MTAQEKEYIELVADRAATLAVEKYVKDSKINTHIAWLTRALIAVFTAIGALAYAHFK